MKAVELNIDRMRGDTAPIDFVLSSNKTKKALVLTGNTFIISVSAQENPVAASYLFQVSATIVEEFGGKISFPMSALNSDQLGINYYDVAMISNGLGTTIIKGVMEFFQDIGK